MLQYINNRTSDSVILSTAVRTHMGETVEDKGVSKDDPAHGEEADSINACDCTRRLLRV